MPLTCIVVNCGSRADRDKVSFYSMPTALSHKHKPDLNLLSKQRREKWLKAIKREDLTDSKVKYQRVCNKHFISGKPATLENVDHPDWVPSQQMGYISGLQYKGKSAVDRNNRKNTRNKIVAAAAAAVNSSIQHDEEQHGVNENAEAGTSVQTDLTMEELSRKFADLNFANSKLLKLKEQINKMSITLKSLEGDDDTARYCAGLDYKLLNIVYNNIKNCVPPSSVNCLDVSGQLILTLMKLRQNLDFKHLSLLCGISATTASTYFENIIDILYQRFSDFIVWPDRSVAHKNMPSCFKETYDKTTVIVGCFEVFIQRPSNYLTRAQCWSNYKHHTTIKFLIGITGQGTVSYISNAWGGRISDKQLTNFSKFLDCILPNDVVLADRGFLISDDLQILGAKLVIPAFTKGKRQLHPFAIEETRQIAHVRIHVERVIGLLKAKYRIFQGTIPISMISNIDNNKTILDKIVVVCCVLLNCCPSIVPL